MFDPLDEQFRWCVFCKADCWPEPQKQKHNIDCPMSTGLWPITETDYNMDMCCGMCYEKFELNEFSMQFDVEKQQVSLYGTLLEVICIGCAAAITILGVKYE